MEPNSANNKKYHKVVSIHDQEEEKLHFQKIVAAFRFYKVYSTDKINHSQTYLMKLPENHQRLLHRYKDHLNQMRSCIEQNDVVLKAVIKDVGEMFENIYPLNALDVDYLFPSAADIEKVHVTLKQIARDWSHEGAKEREACYQPIIDEILLNFPVDKCDPHLINILVPGAGLGRLAYEIASKGYSCQGNEFSLYMLFASNFVLNKCNTSDAYQIYPWVHQNVNNLKNEHQIQAISFPDISPSPLKLPPNVDFSMAAGDFLEVYNQSNEWDCLATCFFIDCAHNIAAFIECIYNILKPGGIWINLGPLLYHYANLSNEESIEPSYEIVREIILGMGFKIKKENTNHKTQYAQNPNSMLQYEYGSIFFMCEKPLSETEDNEEVMSENPS